jgi:hypothetical protein
MEDDPLKKILALTLMLAFALPAIAAPQKKAPPRSKRRAPAAPAPAPAPVDFGAEATKVAEQLKLVARFVYVYGKIANGLEVADDQAKRGETSPALTAKNQQSKESIVSNINGLRAGIDKVVKDFQGNPRLQVQYLKVSGASDAAANAERAAAAGRFDEAGKALITAVDRLAETLVALK